VTRTYLQMTWPDDLRSAATPEPEPRVERLDECPPSFFRYLYVEVGHQYRWSERLSWSDERIAAHLADPNVSLWLLVSPGSPAGYFELKRHGDDSVEIASFGLLPEFTGRGWGKYLLTRASRAAWESRPGRVWLDTCTLDHPAARPNYVRRGFQPFREEVYTAEVPPGTKVLA
jgi:GNAT superfamily N-acetyltransferase